MYLLVLELGSLGHGKSTNHLLLLSHVRVAKHHFCILSRLRSWVISQSPLLLHGHFFLTFDLTFDLDLFGSDTLIVLIFSAIFPIYYHHLPSLGSPQLT